MHFGAANSQQLVQHLLGARQIELQMTEQLARLTGSLGNRRSACPHSDAPAAAGPAGRARPHKPGSCDRRRPHCRRWPLPGSHPGETEVTLLRPQQPRDATTRSSRHCCVDNHCDAFAQHRIVLFGPLGVTSSASSALGRFLVQMATTLFQSDQSCRSSTTITW